MRRATGNYYQVCDYNIESGGDAGIACAYEALAHDDDEEVKRTQRRGRKE